MASSRPRPPARIQSATQEVDRPRPSATIPSAPQEVECSHMMNQPGQGPESKTATLWGVQCAASVERARPSTEGTRCRLMSLDVRSTYEVHCRLPFLTLFLFMFSVLRFLVWFSHQRRGEWIPGEKYSELFVHASQMCGHLDVCLCVWVCLCVHVWLCGRW